MKTPNEAQSYIYRMLNGEYENYGELVASWALNVLDEVKLNIVKFKGLGNEGLDS